MPIKSESQEDPYHFRDEEALPDRGNTQLAEFKPKPELSPIDAPKKRGRKKKIKPEPVNGLVVFLLLASFSYFLLFFFIDHLYDHLYNQSSIVRRPCNSSLKIRIG